MLWWTEWHRVVVSLRVLRLYPVSIIPSLPHLQRWPPNKNNFCCVFTRNAVQVSSAARERQCKFHENGSRRLASCGRVAACWQSVGVVNVLDLFLRSHYSKSHPNCSYLTSVMFSCQKNWPTHSVRLVCRRE